jgi:hypothetical protein
MLNSRLGALGTICSFTYFATSWVNPTKLERKAWPAESAHLQQVRRLAAVDRPRAAAIEFDETALTRHDFRLARGGFGGLHETSKVEIRVQLVWIWDGALAAGGGGGVDIRKEVCGFEELGPLQWRLVCN